MDERQQLVEDLYHQIKSTEDYSRLDELLELIKPLIKALAHRVANGDYHLFGDLISEGYLCVIKKIMKEPEIQGSFGALIRVTLMRNFKGFLYKRRLVSLSYRKAERFKGDLPRFLQCSDREVLYNNEDVSVCETHNHIREVDTIDFIDTHLKDPKLREIFRLKALGYKDVEISEMLKESNATIHRRKNEAFEILKAELLKLRKGYASFSSLRELSTHS